MFTVGVNYIILIFKEIKMKYTVKYSSFEGLWINLSHSLRHRVLYVLT